MTERLLPKAIEEEINSAMVRIATEFIDITELSAPSGEKHLLHVLTGKTLIVTVRWKEES